MTGHGSFRNRKSCQGLGAFGVGTVVRCHSLKGRLTAFSKSNDTKNIFKSALDCESICGSI